jgi:hypothetical protein
VKLQPKRWWATWEYGGTNRRVKKELHCDALPLTYAMATTPDSSQGEQYDYVHVHTKSMKAKDKNMLYMCSSRCTRGPWEGGLAFDEQELSTLYDVVTPHHKSVLFEVETLKARGVPESALARAYGEREALIAPPPPGIAAQLAAQEAAAAQSAKRRRTR